MNPFVGPAILIVVGLVGLACLQIYKRYEVAKAVSLAVTLKDNEGAFIGLRTEKHYNRWVFEEVSIAPTKPNTPAEKAAPGRLHVPTSNILYYQEIANVAE